MKIENITRLFLATAALVMLTACNDDYDKLASEGGITLSTDYHLLFPSDESLSFFSSGGTTYTSIYAAGTGWRIDTGASWLQASPQQGVANSTFDTYNPEEVTFSASENPLAGGDRTAISLLQSTDPNWSYSFPITCTQSPATPYVIVASDRDIEVAGGGGDFFLSFSSNDDWEIDFSSTEYWDWISFDETSGNGSRANLRGTVKPNGTGDIRSATIYVRSKSFTNIYGYFFLTQLRPGVEVVGTGAISLDNVASQATLTIKAEAEWTATTTADWLTLTPASGQPGEQSITLTVTANESIISREAYIHFYIGGNQLALVLVEQSGMRLQANGGTDTKRIDSKRQTVEIDVVANTAWNAELLQEQDWLTLNTRNGNGNGTITLTAFDNPNTLGRTARLLIFTGERYTTSPLGQIVTIIQDGKSISVEQNRMVFGDDGGTLSTNVIAEGPWTATPSDSWISVSPTAANGDATLTVTTTENKDDKTRNGTVAITMADKTLTLYVEQQGKMFIVDNAAIVFGSTGGSNQLSLWSNDSWTASVADDEATGMKPDWLSVSPANGTDSMAVTVTATANNRLMERSASIVVEAAHGKKYSIPVVQAIRYLRASSQAFTFLGSGGTLGPLAIATDGKYSISNSASWLRLAADGSDTYTLTAEANDNGVQRTDTILVRCTDLDEASLELKIPVRQVGTVTDISIANYGEDVHYEVVGTNGFSVTITNFATDKDWSKSTSGGNGISVTIGRFGDDNEWNKR